MNSRASTSSPTASIQDDPYDYFDWVRQQGPVWRDPRFGMFIITGHPEAMAVYSDPASFPPDDLATGTYSSCNVVCGSFVKFSEPFVGDDVSDVIVQVSRRAAVQRPASCVRSADPHGAPPPPDAADHAEAAEGERRVHVAVRRPADRRVRGPRVVRDGRRLRGAVHAHRHRRPRRACPSRSTHCSASGCRRRTRRSPTSRWSSSTNGSASTSRTAAASRSNDVLTGLATATFPDGSTPEVKDAALIAANLFVGGQETTVRLLSFALRMLGERPDLQDLVRTRRDLIPNFIEETLRLESPLRTQFRMARVNTTLGGVDIPAGGTVMLVPGACNRDPRMFENPYRVRHRAAERSAAHRLRARHPHVCRRTPGPGRRSGHRQPVPRPRRATSGSPRTTTVRPVHAATSTCRRSSSGDWSVSTSNSRQSAEVVADLPDLRSWRVHSPLAAGRWT